MEVIVAYLHQSKIDLAELFLHRKTTPEERIVMTSYTVTTSVKGAERLVEHLRMTGHISYIDRISE